MSEPLKIKQDRWGMEYVDSNDFDRAVAERADRLFESMSAKASEFRKRVRAECLKRAKIAVEERIAELESDLHKACYDRAELVQKNHHLLSNFQYAEEVITGLHRTINRLRKKLKAAPKPRKRIGPSAYFKARYPQACQ